ncbi:MAG: shikimate dehydrogenase family protein [Acidimicrobiales bacterium]
MIGSPIRHSLSPVLHNAALADAGLDAVYLAFEPSREGLGQFLATAWEIGIAGISVTMPFKTTVVAHTVSAAEEVTRLGSANTLVRTDKGYHAMSTDGAGLLYALHTHFGVNLESLRCVVIGAGGAGGAAALALDRAGAEVKVFARSRDAALDVVARVGGHCRVGDVSDLEAADLVVNATPAGMEGTVQEGLMPIDPERMSMSTLYYDMIYAPEITPLLAEHRARGGRGASGRSMLAGQAAHAFAAWTNRPAPFVVMDRALDQALGH